jgi:ABC-2 type transport system ATP-binding protein
VTNVIEIKNLSKDYETGFWKKKRVRALDDLTLAVQGRQIFGFLGANGAGKTTTIKILMTLLFPSSGTAQILGRDISDRSMHSRIGYCPENPYFYDHLTARELMNYFGELFQLEPAVRKQRTEELLTKVGLDEKDWDKQLRKFSKGMLQRVGLAQSLINEPEVVFLDEPMSGLDPIGRREVRELIAGLPAQGTTVFMSTHILSDAEALCDEVAILRRGRLAAAGKLHDLLSESHEKECFEIVVANANFEKLSGSLNGNVELKKRSADTLMIVNGEDHVEEALRGAHNAGGKLISVNPIRRSLEDLFVEQTKDQ